MLSMAMIVVSMMTIPMLMVVVLIMVVGGTSVGGGDSDDNDDGGDVNVHDNDGSVNGGNDDNSSIVDGGSGCGNDIDNGCGVVDNTKVGCNSGSSSDNNNGGGGTVTATMVVVTCGGGIGDNDRVRWRRRRWQWWNGDNEGGNSERSGGVTTVMMDEDQWAYYSTMSEEVDMDFQDEQNCGVNEGHVDCSDAFNTSEVFATREDVLKWARTVAHENGFVAVIMRSDTYTGSRGRTSFVLIGCERSGKYKCRKKEFVRRDTGTRKCGCPFKIRGKPVHGGEGWTVKLICGIHNHELAKTLVGHPYAGRLTDDEKNIIADMTKSNVKPRNILLTLKEHNANSCTTIKQIYNARIAYRSSIRGDDTEMQHLMRLLERDQYIHWHRLKDQNVVRDLFWCHPDAVKLCNTCHLVFLIDSTYKTNRYRLPLLDFVGVTPTGMTFSAGFAYLEGERVNNLVWALERFQGLFLRNDRFHVVIVTDTDLALMNVVKVVFPECTNLLCRFHIDKNVKAKCKSLIGQKNAWDYIMDSWGNLVDCPSEQEFPELLQRFQVACSPWPMVESAHWSLKRVLQNSVGDICGVWDAMKNMMTLQHTEIRASFETSTNVVGHVFKKTLYKRLLGMVSSNTSVRRSASYFEPPKPARMIPILDQFPPFMHGFIEEVVDVKADGNC
ncbi:protein FAR1-RELATED SEQUENCE 4-like [Glycine max]|uniref:protein FAR1-RELATED SEQUENCE 4-like n=1 Tax=Glycine max TaxID=3847 RepID=UPI0003DE9E3D|nr:protein FAR1-RELATED SEQUENCE 4-like [Glycine max]|eukprot:XP_006598422.1 protein FAR1-RELATED SEQUENCE 4-like [Glycine max]